MPRLLDRGYRVRAMARNPDKLADVPWRDRAELVWADLGDLDSLVAAFDGVDVVYYLVHSMGTSKDFVADEGRAAHNVVTAARRAGVRRLVYLSGLHPPGTQLSPHLESRKAVGDILLGSGIETIVLQAGVVVGSGSASFEMIRHLTDRLPVMTTPKWVHNKIQPIAVGDVLHYLVAAATAEVPSSRTWDIGGPDVLEYGDMMRIYADVAGLGKRYLIVLPFLTPTIASLWVGTVTPIPPGLARPLIESLECDAVMRDHDIDTAIPPPPGGLTRYRRAVALALNRAARGLVDATWSDAYPDGAPAEALPSDPDWAGEIVYTDVRTLLTPVGPSRTLEGCPENYRNHRRREPLVLLPAVHDGARAGPALDCGGSRTRQPTAAARREAGPWGGVAGDAGDAGTAQAADTNSGRSSCPAALRADCTGTSSDCGTCWHYGRWPATSSRAQQLAAST